MERNNLSKIQNVLLDTFKAFAAFCKEHNIKYFAAYGTLIGAIRHHGFIPWDDDIDVFMLRPDYDKLMGLRAELVSGDYLIADYHDKGYPYSFAKFYDKTKTFWEYRQFPFIVGPFIDIFPLDEWDESDESINKFYDDLHHAFWKFRKSISVQTWGEIWRDIIHLNGMEGPVKIVKNLYYKPRYKRYLQEIERLQQHIGSIRGKYYNDYSYMKVYRYEKEWFAEALEVPFEDTTISVPAGYDPCLRILYGDYMTPPPVQSRTGHPAYYINLERRVPVEEIVNERKTEAAPKPMKISVLWNEIKHRKGF